MSNTLDDRSGLTQAFNALWELATPEQREHFKQDEITPKRLSEAITEARIDEVKRIDPTSDYVLNDLVMSVGDRLTQLKDNK